MERLDDILGYGLKIYQRREWFSFSLDSVLLANFCKIRVGTNNILDLGTVNAIIPLILSLRTKASIFGVDIQNDMINLAQKSVLYNHLEKQIKLECCDMKDLLTRKDIYNTYDLILSNPPYFCDYEHSTKNDNIHKTIARHEVKIKLDDILLIGNKLLKDGGVFSMIHRTNRFMDVIDCFRKYKIEPKIIKFIYKNYNSPADMFYIEGIKKGKSGLMVTEPYILYNCDGSMSEQYSKLIKEVIL